MFMVDKELGYLWNYLINLVYEKVDFFVVCVLVMCVILWNIFEEDKNSWILYVIFWSFIVDEILFGVYLMKLIDIVDIKWLRKC